MSIVHYVDKNGERTDFDISDLKQELRCDLCGQFLSATEPVRIKLDWTPASSTSRMASGDAHLDCLKMAAPGLTGKLAIQGPSR